MRSLNQLRSVHPAIWIVLAIAWRIALVFIFSTTVDDRAPDREIANGFGFIANDYHYFIDPAETYYQTGQYAIVEGEPFAGRMPGYAIFYLMFRMLMSQEMANLMMIVMQAVLGGLAAYVLARGAQFYYRRFAAFAVVFAVGFLYPVSAFFDYQTLTEGLAINNLCFAFYFIMRGVRGGSNKWILLAGVFLAWSVFLRPFLGILLPLYGLFLMWQTSGGATRKFGNAVLLGIPFTLALLAWNIRNYQVMDEVVLMETPSYESYGKTYSLAWVSIRNLINDWGGEPAYFEPGSAAEWFRVDRSDKPLDLPDQVYETGCFTPEDLEELKADFQEFHYRSGFDTTLNREIIEQVREYRSCYLEQQTTFDRGINTTRKIAKSIFRSGSSYMPLVEPTFVDKAFRLLFLGMYYLLLLGWLLGAVLVRKGWIWLVPAIALLFGILQVSSVLENRYFLTVFPFVILGFCGAFIRFRDIAQLRLKK